MKRYLLNLGLIATLIFGGNVWGQVSYTGNGNSGFGGAVGGSTLVFTDNGTTITGTFTKGSGNFGDAMVIYISTGAPGKQSITSDDNDQNDGLRRAITNAFGSAINFPSGFEAKYAIGIDVNFGGLFELPTSGNIGNGGLNFVRGVGQPSDISSSSFSFTFDWSEIGLSNSDRFSFVVTYGNPNSGDFNDAMFSSDEGYGEGIPSGNPGFSGWTYSSFFNYPYYYKYDNSWSPNSPNGENQSSRDILVENGMATFSANTTVRDIFIESDATLEIGSQAVLKSEGDITNNGDLVFKSDSNGSGQLDEFDGDILGSGNVTVERFIPARSDENVAFRFLASPVSGVSVKDSWQQSIHVTGTGTGFDVTNTNNSSMFTYAAPDWNAVTNTETELLAHGKGYRTFVRGDRETFQLQVNEEDPLDDASDVTLSAKGTLATGNISAPDMATGNHEFSFVGNPYQAVVDLAALGFSGIENGFAYYWDPTLADNGSFVVINITANSSEVIPNPGSTQVNKFLQPGQAVFFRNTNASGVRTITFTEASKRTGEAQTAIFSEPSIPFVNMRLYEANRFTNGGKEQDAIGLRFFENGNNAVDSNDAAKMGNTSENFGLINSNQLLSIEQRAMPIEGEIFGLFTNNYQHSDYVFHINLQNFPEGLILKLNDTHLNETHILEAGINEITFSVDASLADSANSQRFNLEVGAVTLSVEDFQENSIEVYPNPVANELNIRLDASMQASELAIYNVVGKQVMNVSLDASLGNHQVNTAQLSSGVYLVKVQTARGSFTSKLIKK